MQNQAFIMYFSRTVIHEGGAKVLKPLNSSQSIVISGSAKMTVFTDRKTQINTLIAV